MPKVLIEVAHGRDKPNSNLLFAPLNEKLRGRWDTAKTAHRDPGEAAKALARFHIIPGLYLELDADLKSLVGVGRCYDPLRETAEGRAMWTQLEVVFRQYPELGGPFELLKPIERQLAADGIKEWAYWMRRLIDGEKAIYVSGSGTAQLPSLDEIRRWPGKHRADPWNTGRQEKELEPWRDVVPLPGERGELVGAGAGATGGAAAAAVAGGAESNPSAGHGGASGDKGGKQGGNK